MQVTVSGNILKGVIIIQDWTGFYRCESEQDCLGVFQDFHLVF